MNNNSNQEFRRLSQAIILLIAASLIIFGISCDRPAKTVKLKLKLNPGLKTVYNYTNRSEKIVMEGDSLLSQSSKMYQSKYTELVDSLAGDTASWVSVSSIVVNQQYTQADTTVTDTTRTERQYQYLGFPTGEILTLIPLVGVDQEWADNQLEYLKQVQPTFPQIDISVGYKWTKTTKVLLFGESREATGVYTLKSFVRERGYDCAVIEYEGFYHLPVKREDEKVNVTGISTITTKGTYYFAYREGIMVDDKVWWVFNSDRTITYLADCKSGHKAGDVQKINIVVEGDTRTTLSDIVFPELK